MGPKPFSACRWLLGAVVHAWGSPGGCSERAPTWSWAASAGLGLESWDDAPREAAAIRVVKGAQRGQEGLSCMGLTAGLLHLHFAQPQP